MKRFLGEGGKKRVFLVYDTLLDRDVAFSLIKVQGLDETGIERIKREAQLMGRLGDHPHIVSLYDIGDEVGQPFLVSQLMGGGDVEGLIDNAPDHRPALDVALRIGDQVCQALEYAHSHGVIHRDLKPGNVWLTADGTAKLGDFGLAIALDRTRLSVAGMIVGTVGYLPPEQALGRQPDGRSDLYSLGAMLYELVTGRPPFLGDDPVAIISQHLNTQPVAPHWHSPDVPKPLEALIMRLLAKDPEERPHTATAVREELQTILAVLNQPAPHTSRDQTSSDIRNPLDRLAGHIFVGRERELGQLRQAVDASLGGVGQIVLLVGEPGIGKTTLAEELVTYARLRGTHALWSRNYEWEGTPAYWAWVQLIRDYAYASDPQHLRSELGAGGGMIAQVVSELHDVVSNLSEAPVLEGEGARFRLFDAVATFLRNASRRQPLVLVIDDLHWADAPSLLLLQYLARELRDARILLIGTYRDVEVGRRHPLAGTLAELAREQRLQRLTLRGLSREDVARYVELTSGTLPKTELTEAILRQTEGNPFFVAEVVRLLVSEDNLVRDGGGTWSVSLPQGVREVVGRRLDRLSAPCNEFLSTAAVIGREFDARLLAAVVQQPTDYVLEVLEEALGARVIREGDDPGNYRFQQELIQETLYEELSIAQRRRLNSNVARALEKLHAGDRAPHFAQLARHFAAAGSGDDAEKAVEYAVKAGNRAMEQAAWETAIAHFQQAIQVEELLDSPNQARSADIHLARGAAQWWSGDIPAGQHTYYQAAQIARSAGLEEQFARAALGYAGADRPGWGFSGEHLVSLLGDALQLVPAGDSILRAKVLAKLAYATRHASEARSEGQANELANEAVAMSRRLRDTPTLVFTLLEKCWVTATPDTVVEHQTVLDELTELVDLTSLDPIAIIVLAHRIISAVAVGDIGEYDRAMALIERYVEQMRDPGWQTGFLGFRCVRAIVQGRFDDASKDIENLRVLSETVPLASRFYTRQMLLLFEAQGRLDDLTGRQVEETITSTLIDTPALALCIRALVELAKADTQAARATFERLAAHGFNDIDSHDQWILHMALLSDIAVKLSDESRAAHLYALLTPYQDRFASHMGWATWMGPVAYYLGLLATMLRDWEGAERHLNDALGMSRRAGLRVYTTRTNYAFAYMLVKRGERGDEERTLDLVDKALAAAEEIGMVKLAEEALALKVQIQGILKA